MGCKEKVGRLTYSFRKPRHRDDQHLNNDSAQPDQRCLNYEVGIQRLRTELDGSTGLRSGRVNEETNERTSERAQKGNRETRCRCRLRQSTPFRRRAASSCRPSRPSVDGKPYRLQQVYDTHHTAEIGQRRVYGLLCTIRSSNCIGGKWLLAGDSLGTIQHTAGGNASHQGEVCNLGA